MTPPLRWHQTLAARLGLGYVLFVVAGSMLLLGWLRHQQQREAEAVFMTLARTDADFVKRLNLPRSAKLAEDLRELLGMGIHFRDAEGRVDPPLPPALAPLLAKAEPRGEVYRLPEQRQALVLRLDARHDMLFVRQAAVPALSLLHPATRNALVTFWLLSAALAWLVAGQVLRPLRALTRKLPGFFAAPAAPLPEAVRRDEIGRLAQALAQSRDELLAERLKREQSERLALLGRVATGLAHDIKNPLASIQLHAELMTPPPDDAEAAAALRLIRDEGKVIEGLVNQWLYLARPSPPRLATVGIQSCLAKAVQSVRGQAEHAGVTVKETHAEAEPAVMGDRARLEQAFRNILVNAIQAMPGGGVLEVNVTPSAKEVVISFADSGPGFSTAALERGTDLFYSEKEGGMGVGLNVVAEIISAHGGRMTLKNRPTGGASVELSLPAGGAPSHSAASFPS
jgi:signal transduction histidine kinase